MSIIKNIADEQSNVCVVNLNPFRIQDKTISYEIFDQLGKLPDYHFLPVGNAGNINAHWIGYKEISGQSFNHCNLCSVIVNTFHLVKILKCLLLSITKLWCCTTCHWKDIQ